MTTLTVEIDKERDLPVLQALLNRMNLNFKLEEDDDDWGDLPEAAIEGIKAGIEDIKAGRVHTHAEVMAYMEEKLNHLRAKNG